MINERVKQSIFYSEMDSKKLNHYFSFSKEKFHHNIDSLYFMVSVNKWGYDSGSRALLSLFERLREDAAETNDAVLLKNHHDDKDLDLIVLPFGVGMYPFGFESKGRYHMFISRGNMNNPDIWVQVQSEFLWLYGEHDCLRMALNDIERLLEPYDLEISMVRENRIDFAYHTNYIQDMTNFFKPGQINSMQVSNFKRGSIEFELVGSDTDDVDYLTLGRKKSNNLFFRVYNKTKEVIQRGYKQFFIELWRKNKLISRYDQYCIEKAFHRSTYSYLDIARLEFYIDFGVDEGLKTLFRNAIKSENHGRIRDLAEEYTPRVTMILNIEIETKRKFYYSMRESTQLLLKKSKKAPEYADGIFRLLDNKDLIHDELTHNVIRFINRSSNDRKSRCDTAYWWKRLQQCKVNRKYKKSDVKLYRTYQKEHDIQKSREYAMRGVSNFVIKKFGDDAVMSDFQNDVLDLMAMLTENEIQQMKSYKLRKLKQQPKDSVYSERIKGHSRYAILDSQTGEYHE